MAKTDGIPWGIYEIENPNCKLESKKEKSKSFEVENAQIQIDVSYKVEVDLFG